MQKSGVKKERGQARLPYPELSTVEHGKQIESLTASFDFARDLAVL